jgi:nucleotide-binding universal stress UspA family protein
MNTTLMSPTKDRGRRVSTKAASKRASLGTEDLQICNVLVPIDFSQPSLETIEFALPLVKLFGAEFHLVHVVPPDYPFTSLVDLPMVVPELEIGRRVRTRLKDAAKKYSVELRRENIHALRGSPFEQICQLARDAKIDMIIMPTRGHTGLKHLMLGSTTERVVRHSPCPVLVVHLSDIPKRGNGKLARRHFGFGKILVPIDFSDCSAKGLKFATTLARRLKSKLVLLHAVNLSYYVTSDEYARYDFPLLLEQTQKAAQEQLAELVRQTDWGDLQVETSLQTGHAGQQICGRVRDLGVDLIVTSTHGRTGFKHVLLGSTAEYVVRHASVPVLVVPSHERPAVSSTVTRL